MALRHSRFEFIFGLRLGLAQHILDDLLAGLGIIPGGVPAFPASVLPVSDAALSVSMFLSPEVSSPVLPPCRPADLRRSSAYGKVWCGYHGQWWWIVRGFDRDGDGLYLAALKVSWSFHRLAAVICMRSFCPR